MEIKKGDVAYTTGAFVEWTGSRWEVVRIEDDTYYDGKLVQDFNGKPYIE